MKTKLVKYTSILLLSLIGSIMQTQAQMPHTYPPGITLAHSFADVEPAGITLSENGRLFMCLPRGGVNHKHPSVVEIIDGKAVAFPNKAINQNVDTDLPHHLVSVLGITLYKNTLWILDQGKRAGIDGIPDGSTKIVAVDINTKEVIKNIPIPRPFFRETIQLNDLRFDPTHGKEGTIYISNNGFAKPDQSIIVADVATGKLRELFRDAPEVSPVKGFMTYVEGFPHTLSYEKPTMPQGGVNGIELSPDFKTLYWTIPTNPNFYSIPTEIISDAHLSESDIKKAIKWEGQIVSNGGITIDEEGTLYFGDASRYSILKKDTAGNVSLAAYDPRLIWPDGMIYWKGNLYVTIGQWHRAPGLNDGKDLRHGPYEVLKIPITEKAKNQ
ncbi:L-dopachrome tautomerase-related protein [Olivibacter sitiensis]|uniref:L-dopachrome tautomerase-related protein n=1 Tax=Olivibacter sitiensis TaxID=376470 RepID=UPI00055E4294|nr:L-dopachrome tautomerase-related protein [Olivibacter sitiensis]